MKILVTGARVLSAQLFCRLAQRHGHEIAGIILPGQRHQPVFRQTKNRLLEGTAGPNRLGRASCALSQTFVFILPGSQPRESIWNQQKMSCI